MRNLVKSIDEPVRSRRNADSDLLEIESLFSENINVEERQARAADTRVCLNLELRIFFSFFNPQTPVAQKNADEVVFRHFRGEGVEFF